ncbi:MAG: hypothetical protein ABFC94_04860 [Syntrophomonas sp.]
MRNILRKLERRQPLQEAEYEELLEYARKLSVDSPESYLLFFEQYADFLLKDYSTYLPRFAKGRDDFINFLLSRPDLVQRLRHTSLLISDFPVEYHPYLMYTFAKEISSSDLPLLDFLTRNNELINELPCPRTTEIVYKYEEANPYKEPGLKVHFEHIGRYSFVTRVQSYRYLTRNKAHADKIDLVGPDRLGGIFTNKQKSIYYYIYLTEQNEAKAQNACRILHLALGHG